MFYLIAAAARRFCVAVAVLLCGTSVSVAAAGDFAATPDLLTNLCQLRETAEQEVRVIHPFRVVAEVLDVDSDLGVMALRDSSSTELIRVGITNRDIHPGTIVSLEGRGCAVRLERFGLAIEPGEVVDNDGVHPMISESCKIFLPAGMHPIKLEWFNWFGDLGFSVEYEGPNISRQRIPGSMLNRAVVNTTTGLTNFLPGLNYKCWEGVWELMPDFAQLQPVKTGAATNFDINVRTRTEAVGMEFSGFISIREPGIYTFHMASDDGGRLFVGQPFVEVRVLKQADEPMARELPPASLLQTNRRSWVTLEGMVSGAGVWTAGGASRLRVENEDIRLEIFDSRDFVPGLPLRRRVRVSGIYETALSEDGAQVPVRLMILNWSALKSVAAESRVAPTAGDRVASSLPHMADLALTNGEAVLTTAAEIKALSGAAAEQGIPISIRGVITASLSKHLGAVLQDGTAGVFLQLLGSGLSEPLQCGELCQIEGVTGQGWFAPVVVARRVTRLGIARMPKPLQPSRDQLVNGSLDTEYAEIDGVVTAINERRLTLLTQGDKISLELTEFRPEALRQFQDAVIRVRGCFFVNFDYDTRQLEAGALTLRTATIDVLQPAPPDLFDAPRRSIRELLFYDPKAAPFRRLKVAGQVIHSRGRECFLTDGTNGLFVTARNRDPLAVGDLVDAVGFLSLRGHSAELNEAMIRKTGRAPLPAATKIPPDQLFQARHAGTLVQVEATLINHWREASERVMELQSGFLAFKARIRDDGQSVSLPPSGSRLALTGVYAPEGNSRGDGSVNSVDLLLSSPAAIRVLTTPPWWTLKRVLILSGVLTTILFAVLLWNKELHEKVEQRGHQLETEIRNRQHAELRHAAEAERARIARDLHDELGTGLTEVSLLASAGLGHFQDAEKIRDRFQSIAEKSRGLVSGLDVIVWAIDPKRNSLQSFADYIGTYVRELFASAPIDCRLRIRIEQGAVTLSEAERHSLFLAVKETLNNVIRHASATEVEFQISQTGDRLMIMIADNGRGFDSHTVERGNGLGNLRERLEAMRGECVVESQPGKGTTVKFIVPLPHDPG